MDTVAGTIDSCMPGSDADRGPLRNLTGYGPALVDTLAEGVESRLPRLESAMTSMPRPGLGVPAGAGRGRGRMNVRNEVHVEYGDINVRDKAEFKKLLNDHAKEIGEITDRELGKKNRDHGLGL